MEPRDPAELIQRNPDGTFTKETLTRAMTSILCKGLDGATPQEILDLPSDFVTRIVGAELVRVRSQTTYYVLTRIKGICKVYLDRQRARQVA